MKILVSGTTIAVKKKFLLVSFCRVRIREISGEFILPFLKLVAQNAAKANDKMRSTRIP